MQKGILRKYDAANTSQEPRRSMGWGLRCLLLLLLIFSVGIFASQMLKYRELTEEKAKLEKQKQAYKEQIDRADYYIRIFENGTVDYDEIIQIARDKFNLGFPDETIYHTGRR